MSLLKPSNDLISSDTWVERIKSEWDDSSTALNIIITNDETLFKEHLKRHNAWEWFRLLIMTDFPKQMQWLEKTVLNGVPVDRHWYQLDTGHQVTVFDLVDTVSGGIRDETRQLLLNIRTLYHILFLRQDVQSALDIVNELRDEKKWIELNVILSMNILGPLHACKPLLHYVVMLERYDLARGLLDAATTLQSEFKSQTFLNGWMNMKNDDGQTVLHITAVQRRESWAKWFISNGANPTVRDSNNKTPFHYAPILPYLDIFNNNGFHISDILDELLVDGCSDSSSLEWILKNGGNANTPGCFDASVKKSEHLAILVKGGGDPTCVEPTRSWSPNAITCWLNWGGCNSQGYTDLVIKHLSYHQQPEWICMLLAMNKGHEAEARHWWSKCNEEEREKYYEVIQHIKPTSARMKEYKSLVEKVKNMNTNEYINDIKQ